MKNKRNLIIVLLIVGIVMAYLILQNNISSNRNSAVKELPKTSENTSDNIKIYADLNGNGQKDYLVLNISSDRVRVDSIIAYDPVGKVIGKLPDGMPILAPMTNSGKVYTPNTKEKNQFVSFDFSIGPHSSETMFFGLFKLKDNSMGVLPICLSENANEPSACLFWSGEIGELLVRDLDNDGVIEVVETVDEYPKDGPITTDIEKIINEEFKDLGQDVADGMTRIAKREQGGRGNKVIWGLYRYNGSWFENQLGKKYDKYYTLAKEYLESSNPNYPEVMRKSEMSTSSLDYNEFMRKFWTHR